MKVILILAALGLFSAKIFSSEVDSFHHRYDALKDATDQINQYSNKLFDSVLEKINKNANLCDDPSLYKNLRKEFHNGLYGKFNKFISDSTEIDRVKMKTADSIYGNFTTSDSIILGFYSKHITDPLASVLNIHGHFVGTDKFEHFAGTGFLYFENHYLKKNSIESTLAIGQHDENGLLGADTTGVISYGDMSAEFNGMRFWNDILAKNPDVLGANLGPYVKCEAGLWKKVKEIDFSQYVDDAWDEGLNCSTFRTEKMLKKVKQNIKALEEADRENYTCPIKPERIVETMRKYGSYADILINTSWGKAKKN